MPLTHYTCTVAGGCELYVPGSEDPVPSGTTGAKAVPLGAALAIPSLEVAPGTDPGSGAIRVAQGGATWYVWAQRGKVRWMSGAAPWLALLGPAATEGRTFNLWTDEGSVRFAVT